MNNLTIYKYPLHVREEQLLTIPEGAVAVHVGAQGRELCVWALVDRSARPVQAKVRIYGTGFAINGDLEQVHLGTVQQGLDVWHVFWEMAG